MRKEPVVIFSSCDENYMKHIPTLLMSVREYMSAYSIEFYFLHISVKPAQIKKLRKFCNKIGISFQAIQIDGETLAQYRILKRLTSAESTYPVEGFFDILPNLHLPPHVGRALYLDAGDTILSGDISRFYFSDFNGNILTVAKGFAESWDYTAEDLYERQKYLQMAAEYFNAGVVLFNVALMRRLNINFDYYMSIVKLAKNVHDGYNWDTFGGGGVIPFRTTRGCSGLPLPAILSFLTLTIWGISIRLIISDPL